MNKASELILEVLSETIKENGIDFNADECFDLVLFGCEEIHGPITEETLITLDFINNISIAIEDWKDNTLANF